MINKVIASITIWSVLIFPMTGCKEDGSRIRSDDVPTSSIYAAIEVVSDVGGALFVSAQLRRGGAMSDVFIDISGDDRLIASVGKRYAELNMSNDLFTALTHLKDEHREMEQVSQYRVSGYLPDYLQLPSTWYKAEFPNVEIVQRIYVSLYRKDQTDSDGSYVQLPEKYNITRPISGNDALYSRSTDDIVVEWTALTNESSRVVVDVLAECENGKTGSWRVNLSTDVGEVTIPSDAISNITGLCSYLIRVKKIKLGNFDPRFGGGGIIQGAQIRSVSVNTTD